MLVDLALRQLREGNVSLLFLGEKSMAAASPANHMQATKTGTHRAPQKRIIRLSFSVPIPISPLRTIRPRLLLVPANPEPSSFVQALK